ncbi:MAG: ABC transporter ATP-binding protein, partial [Sulfurifustis sp.]
MMSVRGLHVYYGRAHVLADIALDVAPGEVVVLLGRNGAGKSTTLKSIIGLVRPAGGDILFNGRRIERLPPYQIARAGLGYVPEERRVFTDLTIMQNLDVGRQPPRANAQNWTPAKLFALFPQLADMQQRSAASMSGGEQQM